MIVLGIDPGTASTGYGIIKGEKLKFKCLGYGVIKTEPKFSQGERLKKINNDLSRIIREYKPKVVVIENLFFFKNFKTALPVSRAEGVILLTAAKKGIPIYQFTPLQVKSAVTKNGWAEKSEVQKKLKRILKLKQIPKPDDAADALAIALTYFIKKS